MSITYFLMLFFVFITLFVPVYRWLQKPAISPKEHDPYTWPLLGALLYASLGTFFFHNVW